MSSKDRALRKETPIFKPAVLRFKLTFCHILPVGEGVWWIRKGTIFFLNREPQKLIDKIMYLCSRVSFTESDVNIQLVAAWIIWSIQVNKMGFLPNCGCVTNTVWMYNMDSNNMHREKARFELHKNDTSYREHILEATLYETTSVWPLTSHLSNHPSRTNKTCRTLLEKQGRTYKWRSSMNPYTWTTTKKLFTSALCGKRM